MFCCYFCWSWRNYCFSPTAEEPIESGLLQLSQGCSDCETLADLWNLPSIVFLKNSQGSSRDSLPELMPPCDVSSWSDSATLMVPEAKITTSGQELFGERSPVGSWFSELLFLDSPGTAREQLRSCGFRRNSSNLDKAPKMRNPVQLDSRLNFWWPSFHIFQKFGWCTLQPTLDYFCFVTGCSLCFLVFLAKLSLKFSFFSNLPYHWGKNMSAGKSELILCF